MKHTIPRGISRWIARHDSTRAMVLLLLAAGFFFWLFNFSSWPYSDPGLIRLSGGEGWLDLRPFYTAQQAFTAMGHYGEAGRALYRGFLATDFVFIPVYSLGFALLLTRLLRALTGEGSGWMRLNLLPLVIGLFDVVENLSILSLLAEYPHPPAIIGTLAGIATLCKWLLTALALLVLGIGTVAVVFRSRRRA